MQLILTPGVDILGWRALAGAQTAFGVTFYHRLQKWETTHAQRKKTRDQSDSESLDW